MTARKWILKSHFAGFPKREDLEIVEETLPALGNEGRPYWPRVYYNMHASSRHAPYNIILLGGGGRVVCMMYV